MIELERRQHGWLLVALLALSPLWLLGLFDRAYWTPDEPREADIAWRMSVQADRTLPQLADTRFLEKPPLSYWLSAAAMHAFGDSAAAARLPNLFYAIAATLAIGLLVHGMAGNIAAAIATIIAGSALTAYQVSIWLAPDACLMAGCTIALLGVYRGYCAARGRSKLLWYSVMHGGALIGFMAKSGPGWLVPGLALLVLIAWERRWQELRYWELWAGAILQMAAIGAWVVAVLFEPDGANALHILFWNNLAGRFADLPASGALNYAHEHRNWPGKYWLELPYHLFPWTSLVAAASYRAWGAVRLSGRSGTPWRFAIAASIPWMLLLSFAATARGIYIAPALPGFAMLVGLWSQELSITPSKADDYAIRTTRYAVAAMTLLMFVGVLAILMAGFGSSETWPSMLAAVAIIVLAGLTIRRSMIAQRQRRIHGSLAWAYLAFAFSVGIGGSVLMPRIDEWQDLQTLATAIKARTSGHSLALIQPDETTIAMLDHRLRTPVTVIGNGEDSLQTVTTWLHNHAAGSMVLILLPGHADGELSALLPHRRTSDHPLDDKLLRTLEQEHIAHVVARYQLPQGRRYALVAANS